MTLKYQEIIKILEHFEQSNLKNMSLKEDDFELMVSKTHSLAGLGTSAQPSGQASVQPPAQANTPSSAPMVAEAPASTHAPAAEPTVPTDTIDIISPMVGTFYTTPDPKSPPFVSVGDHIDADTTVGIVEVMKVFNAIEAKVAGEVVEILVEHQATVEYGQPLFRVKPL